MHVPCNFDNHLQLFQLTSSSCFSLRELVDLPHTLSGPCLICFPIPLASKDTPISAGNAIRVLLVAVQLISLSLIQAASPGAEITSNYLN